MGFLYFFQEMFIFQPKKLAESHIFQFDQPFEEFFLKPTADAKLDAIHFKNKNPKGVVLYFHGNRGNLDRWGQIASFFAKKNYDVIVMDYRTYGKSTGTITEDNLYNDAQLFYQYALKYYTEKQIVVYGRSLGTVLATKIAAKNNPRNLILETPYYSMTSLVTYRVPFLLTNRMVKYSFPTNHFINDVACPITIYHGTEDGVVPYKFGDKLYKSIFSTQKRMITIDGGSHNDLINFDTYLTTIDSVLERRIDN